jgi:hypothetical protein
MYLVLGECRGNSATAVRRYAKKCPNRQVPNRRTFLSVDQRIRETETTRRIMVMLFVHGVYARQLWKDPI